MRVTLSDLERMGLRETRPGVLERVLTDVPAVTTPVQKLPRGPNKTEADFGRILEAMKSRGEIVEYRFEGLRLKWGGGMHYKPDFVVILPDGRLRVYEVKGPHIWDRDLVRFKGCRAEWSGIEFELWQRKGTWERRL